LVSLLVRRVEATKMPPPKAKDKKDKDKKDTRATVQPADATEVAARLGQRPPNMDSETDYVAPKTEEERMERALLTTPPSAPAGAPQPLGYTGERREIVEGVGKEEAEKEVTTLDLTTLNLAVDEDEEGDEATSKPKPKASTEEGEG
jgi:hypothetical protein